MTDPAALPDLSAFDAPEVGPPADSGRGAPGPTGPAPAEIDDLARRAVEAADETEAGQRWGALWRAILPFERWYFVRDASDELRPAAVDVNGQLAIPVFTDVGRATAFAVDGHGGADRVFASPPEEMLNASDQLEASGIELLIFNLNEVPFGAPPGIVRTLARDFAAAMTRAQQPMPAPETEIDLLAASARAHVTDVPTQAALWQAVFGLEHWFFIPRGEGAQMKPYAEQTVSGPAIIAFTTPQRAKAYADARDLGETDKLLGIPPVAGIGALEQFTGAGIQIVHFDPQHASFFAPVDKLREMHAHATGTDAASVDPERAGAAGADAADAADDASGTPTGSDG